jgi:hypothetical protein
MMDVDNCIFILGLLAQMRTQTFEREWCPAGWSGAWEAKKPQIAIPKTQKYRQKILDVLTLLIEKSPTVLKFFLYKNK